MSFDDLVGHKPDPEPEPELTTASVFAPLIEALGQLGINLLAALVGTMLQHGASPEDIGNFSQRTAHDIIRASNRRIIGPNGRTPFLLAWYLLLATSVGGELRFEWSPALLNESQCSQVRTWAQNFQDRKNQVYGVCIDAGEAKSERQAPAEQSK